MISVFKNFFNKPDALKTEHANTFIDSIISHIKNDEELETELAFDVASRIYSNKHVKDLLKHAYHDKCAFCEQKIETAIEHFRPKTKYPWLAVEWSNLLPVCSKCDGHRRGKFEIRGIDVTVENLSNDPMILNADSDILVDEDTLLIHPEVDSPENHIFFDFSGNAVGRTEKGRYTIDVFRLNRDELLIKRKK